MWIDSHCHFDAPEFDQDRAAVAVRSQAAGITAIVIPGYVAQLWPKLFDVCRSFSAPRLFPAPGLHPCYIEQHTEADLIRLEELLATQAGIVAVGEIGLDYYVATLKSPELKIKQEIFFREQLRLARAHDLPVILHVRKAHQDVLKILREERVATGGIVHAYSGSLEEAQRYTALGFKLGIGGPLTYDQSKRLRSVVAAMPLSALVLETDAPDMIPRPFREDLPPGQRTRNSPEYLPAVAAAMAELKSVDLSALQAGLWQNTINVLRLPLSVAH